MCITFNLLSSINLAAYTPKFYFAQKLDHDQKLKTKVLHVLQ